MPRRSPIRVLRRELGLRALDRSGDAVAAAIARAVRRARASDWGAEERRWIDAIERRRTELDRSTATLTRGDGGTEILGEVSRASSKAPHLAALLFALLRESGARSALELGTCVGVSAGYQAAALRLNGGEPLVTIDGAPDRMTVARETLAGVGLDDVDARLGEFGAELARLAGEGRRFEYVFIDGNHREAPTLEYHRIFAERLAAPGSIAVFDDITWSDEMVRAWRAAARHPAVRLAVDLGPIGVVVHGDGERRSVSAPYA